METNKIIKLHVEMDVTIPQALALKEMFEYWNWLGIVGSSRKVGFFADGDGNFHPNCKITTSETLPILLEAQKKKAIVEDIDGDRTYDYDAIAWGIRK